MLRALKKASSELCASITRICSSNWEVLLPLSMLMLNISFTRYCFIGVFLLRLLLTKAVYFNAAENGSAYKHQHTLVFAGNGGLHGTLVFNAAADGYCFRLFYFPVGGHDQLGAAKYLGQFERGGAIKIGLGQVNVRAAKNVHHGSALKFFGQDVSFYAAHQVGGVYVVIRAFFRSLAIGGLLAAATAVPLVAHPVPVLPLPVAALPVFSVMVPVVPCFPVAPGVLHVLVAGLKYNEQANDDDEDGPQVRADMQVGVNIAQQECSTDADQHDPGGVHKFMLDGHHYAESDQEHFPGKKPGGDLCA